MPSSLNSSVLDERPSPAASTAKLIPTADQADPLLYPRFRKRIRYWDGQRSGDPMNRSNALWLIFALLSVMFLGVTVALFTHESSRPFGWITLVSAIVIVASAWLGYRRSKL